MDREGIVKVSVKVYGNTESCYICAYNAKNYVVIKGRKLNLALSIKSKH